MNNDYYSQVADAKTRRESLRRAAEQEHLAKQMRPQNAPIKHIRRIITAAGSFVIVNGQRIAEENRQAPAPGLRTSTQELITVND